MNGEVPVVMARHLRITGRVQGVGYRWSMAQEAKRLGVNGWVRNRLDGCVEAVVSGPEESVVALVEWAHRGPQLVRVEAVAVEAFAGFFDGFEQRDTA